MKLDSRIIEGKRPLSCFDTEQAKEFLGKECYFSDHLCTFNELLDAYSYVAADVLVSKEKHLYVGELLTVSDSDGSCYEAGINGEAEWFQFCLPCEWVEEPKKKYRPFTGIEFAEKFDLWVGHIIRIRDLFDNAGQEYEYKIMFVGYRWYKGIFEVFINGCWIDLVTLFKLYEYQEDGKWKKFGLEE